MQDLIMWILADGINTRWIFVENKSLIKHVVIVSVPGLNHELYTANMQQALPSIVKYGSAACCVMEPPWEKRCDTFFDKAKLVENDTKNMSGLTPLSQHWISILMKKIFLRKAEKKKKKFVPSVSATVNAINDATTTTSSTSTVENDAPHTFIDVSTMTPIVAKDQLLLSHAELMSNLFPLHKETDDFVETRHISDHTPRLIAVDCEMVTTEFGMELAKVTLIDEQYVVLYDSYVKPSNAVMNYNTRYIAHSLI